MATARPKMQREDEVIMTPLLTWKISVLRAQKHGRTMLYGRDKRLNEGGA
jgi:hypothetical protein